MSETTRQTAAEVLASYDGRPLRIMEVCGTHTHEIFRLGIRKLLPPQVDLISGPGCPVCVTPVGFIDEAIWLAEHGVTITTFGDLVRVPGTSGSLATARANGARVQVVYSPIDAVAYAKEHPAEQVTFLAVGFETTVPAACLAAEQAIAEGVSNFTLLTANKTMPNAYQALKGSADVFLYPGHVHAITGTTLCEELVEQGVSGVLAGFTAKELVTALAVAVALTIGIPVLSFVFGVDLTGHRMDLAILMIGGGMMAYGVFFNYVITIIREQKFLLISYGVASLAALLLSGPFVTRAGITGASILYAVLMSVLAVLLAAVLVWKLRTRRKEWN